VLVIAPRFEGIPERERDVVRVPAVQHFNGSDFSVPVPVPRRVAGALSTFAPQIVHSHHPFLFGDTALRVAAARAIPVVFTYHTMYEQYTHYVPGHSPRLKRFVVELATGYCNLCDAVIAPSTTVAELLVRRGVKVSIEIIATGVERDAFASGDGPGFRQRAGIPLEAFVVGHVGRLAPEKNLGFLAAAVACFLLHNAQAHFLVAGDGPSLAEIQRTFAASGLTSRLHVEGVLGQRELADVYQSMDVFAFASQTETQGMVLTEAMAAGVPVVAVDASGVRDVVRDRENGRLVVSEDVEEFVAALSWIAALTPIARQHLGHGVARTAAVFSMTHTAARTLALYAALCTEQPAQKDLETSVWTWARRRVAEEWKIVSNLAHAAGDAVLSRQSTAEPDQAEGAG
jgi:glycosyltransferase involved in cell wall biosynthesis